MSIGDCIFQLMSHKQTLCVKPSQMQYTHHTHTPHTHTHTHTHTHLDLLMLPISESLLESMGPAVPMLK